MRIGTTHHELEVAESDDGIRVHARPNGKVAVNFGWQYTITGTPDALYALGQQLVDAARTVQSEAAADDLDAFPAAS